MALRFDSGVTVVRFLAFADKVDTTSCTVVSCSTASVRSKAPETTTEHAASTSGLRAGLGLPKDTRVQNESRAASGFTVSSSSLPFVFTDEASNECVLVIVGVGVLPFLFLLKSFARHEHWMCVCGDQQPRWEGRAQWICWKCRKMLWLGTPCWAFWEPATGRFNWVILYR